ncbi:MAG: hypothetical protein ABSC31_00650 [Acidimicrobiales bacterium]|jgi:hypothetical protein
MTGSTTKADAGFPFGIALRLLIVTLAGRIVNSTVQGEKRTSRAPLRASVDSCSS